MLDAVERFLRYLQVERNASGLTIKSYGEDLQALTDWFVPARRSDHVFEPLAASPHITIASSQFAFEYYQSNLEKLRGRLAIESFYGDAYAYVCEKFGSFRDWAYDFVPRFKNESGLILYFEVSSLETGKELWETWQQAHRT